MVTNSTTISRLMIILYKLRISFSKKLFVFNPFMLFCHFTHTLCKNANASVLKVEHTVTSSKFWRNVIWYAFTMLQFRWKILDIFLIFAPKHILWRGGSNVYPQSMF